MLWHQRIPPHLPRHNRSRPHRGVRPGATPKIPTIVLLLLRLSDVEKSVDIVMRCVSGGITEVTDICTLILEQSSVFSPGRPASGGDCPEIRRGIHSTILPSRNVSEIPWMIVFHTFPYSFPGKESHGAFLNQSLVPDLGMHSKTWVVVF